MILYIKSIENNYLANTQISNFLEIFQKFNDDVVKFNSMINLVNQQNQINIVRKNNYNSRINISENLSSNNAQTNANSNNPWMEQNLVNKDTFDICKGSMSSIQLFKIKKKGLYYK